MTEYNEASVPDQSGKTCFITGANTGIGYEAARILAQKNARVLLGCRSEEKAHEAMAQIRQEHASADLDWIALDLTNLSSVADAASRVNQEPRLDMLINNAGVMVPPLSRTNEGFELQFGVNHLAHFALTGHLLKKLAATSGARVVNVSSGAHRGGRIDFDDPHAEKSYKPMQRYQMSKAANLYFTLELTRKLSETEINITSVACHPGVADTELGRTLPKWFMLIGPLIRPFFNSATEGALPTLMAATLPDVAADAYFGPTKRGEMARSAGPAKIGDHIFDADVAARLWTLSEELTGVTYNFAA